MTMDIDSRANQYVVVHPGLNLKASHEWEDLYESRKREHVTQFAKLLEAPPGFSLVDWPNMHSFHAKPTNDGSLAAFESPIFLEFMDQFLKLIPAGARRWCLYNFVFIFLALKARFTFVDKEGTLEYGTMDEKIYTLWRFEEVQAWVMDPDECPTNNPIILRIRNENANYRRHSHGSSQGSHGSSQGSPGGSGRRTSY